MQPLQLLVERARGPEVRQPELAARVPDAVPQHVERPPPGDLAREPAEEALLHVGPVVLLQLFPLLRLGGQVEPPVVVLRPAPAVAARRRIVSERRW